MADSEKKSSPKKARKRPSRAKKTGKARKGARKTSAGKTRKRPRKTGARKTTKRARKRAAPKKRGGRKYGPKASEKVEETMRERKRGTLRSGSGKKVTSRKQAIAIGLSQARKAGAKVPKKRASD